MLSIVNALGGPFVVGNLGSLSVIPGKETQHQINSSLSGLESSILVLGQQSEV